MSKKQKRILTVVAVVLLLFIALGAQIAREMKNASPSFDLTKEEATVLVNEALDDLADPGSLGALAAAEKLTVTVTEVEKGDAKNFFFACTYETVDVKSAVMAQINELLNIPRNDPETGITLNATQIKLRIQDSVAALVAAAPALSGQVVIEMVEVEEGKLSLFCSDEVVNACYGGILDLHREIENTKEIVVDGETVDISGRTTLRNGLKYCVTLLNYDAERPDASGPVLSALNELGREFYRNFIKDDMWEWLVRGLVVTLELTACAVALGIFLGFVVAVIRTTYDRTGSLGFLNGICKVYLSIIRGTPVMIQLLIIHFVLLLPMGVPKFLSAVLCFGLNSGAYVAEIIRGGMMSVEAGQNEAGRSLGLNYAQTMIYIIIPQAFKAVLPSLANEFIVLLKESSVAFYVGVADLTQAGLRIRAISYSNFLPLIAVAIIYWIVVMILTNLVGILERRLRKSER